MMVHLSRLSEEVIFWASESLPLFGSIAATGSSLMPRKRTRMCLSWCAVKPGAFLVTCRVC